jgi:type IV pilus assembly protein PilO
MKSGILMLVFVALILGLLGGSYYFVFKPASEKREVRKAETEKKRKELAELKRSTAGISDLEKKIREVQDAIRFFDSKLPQAKEVDKILKEVWNLADRNSLQTKTVKTQKAERSAGYSEQPIEISLSGSFEGYYSFLLQIEKLARITRIHNMKLEKITSKDGDMQAKMTLSIFFESDGSAKPLAALE